MQVGGGGAARRDRADRLEHGRGERPPGDGVAQPEGLRGAHLRPAHALGGSDESEEALRRVAGAQGLQDDAPRGGASKGVRTGLSGCMLGWGISGLLGGELCGRRPLADEGASGPPARAGPCPAARRRRPREGAGRGRVQRAMGRVDLPAPVEDGIQRAPTEGRAPARVPLAPHQAARRKRRSTRARSPPLKERCAHRARSARSRPRRRAPVSPRRRASTRWPSTRTHGPLEQLRAPGRARTPACGRAAKRRTGPAGAEGCEGPV